MEQAIRDFPRQFSFDPVIQNSAGLGPPKKFVVCGLGGSHLAADIIAALHPELPLRIHKDYGLPFLSDVEKKETLAILSSYSGNTEEVLDSYEKARRENLPMAIVAAGGKLLALAEKEKLPHIKMPVTGIQPRMALGFSFISFLKLFGLEKELAKAKDLAHVLDAEGQSENAKLLAARLLGKIPVIYSSTKNAAVAYNWKIKMNENAKIPAFMNVLPEMNHNEMTGFDVVPETKKIMADFVFIFIRDDSDDRRIKNRMEVLKKMLADRGLPVEDIDLLGKSDLERAFSSLLLVDWLTVELSKKYGTDPEKVPMVEEFKNLIADSHGNDKI